MWGTRNFTGAFITLNSVSVNEIPVIAVLKHFVEFGLIDHAKWRTSFSTSFT